MIIKIIKKPKLDISKVLPNYRPISNLTITFLFLTIYIYLSYIFSLFRVI